ncbi:MAG TPA: bifunctional 23S rRNA (guanine(2069)-N(7))-methyltransferase RlmK/23S rRNA (guanine(2445)-N(2))-methyltransferase RlmL [Gammaproteobacteria bacterium]|nr:bifunctional 23S rRNA (guanine(2069)-N(7))-methyltransferase RlmK/23S rRNA (guanine(2445)-N(2))-methyltransferase RlmL [Gammaproteobacteria bacterium]
MTEYNYFATCSKGVEDLLQHELVQQGITDSKLRTGGVAFSGELTAAYRACLWSRVASRVLLQLKSFQIASDDDLYREVMTIDWSTHFSDSNTLAIDCFSSHTKVNNSHYATLRIKDAIVDQFTQASGTRPSISKDNPDIRINAYLSDRECLLYLDLSGEALHKRGYRLEAGSAPLRETLAAAMLYRARWPDFYAQKRPFTDPMCGSGTLLVEAAMMAGDIAPGLLREHFGFLHWKPFDESQWQPLLDDARQRKQQGLENLPCICGSDSSEQLVGIARKNLQRAGLPADIRVSLQDATQKLTPCCRVRDEHGREVGGLIVCNPPYGKRIGQTSALRQLYFRFGKQLKANFNGWTVAIISSEAELARSIGLRAFKKNTLYNGPLKSTLYQYRIDESPPGRQTKAGAEDKKLRTDSAQGEAPALTEHAQMFVNRLKKNFKHLRKWARKNDIHCYRVYDADIPQYAVAIDLYENWVHVQEYQAPKTVDSKRAFQRINDVLDVVADVLEVPQDNVVLKVRQKQSGTSQYQKLDKKQQKLVVQENGLKFIVNLYDYLDTGLFLDHRNTRQLIRQIAAGTQFLNLFAYTGSVTVYAAAGGARTTTTVDMSNTYLQWAQENMEINGYGGSPYAQNKHRFIREDCLQWLQQAAKASQQYQLIFIDPPTFSNSKKMQDALDIKRDHVELLRACLKLLSEDGRIIFSTNARGFRMSDEMDALCYLREITAQTTTEDFRRRPAHRCWCLSRDESRLKLPAIV